MDKRNSGAEDILKMAQRLHGVQNFHTAAELNLFTILADNPL